MLKNKSINSTLRKQIQIFYFSTYKNFINNQWKPPTNPQGLHQIKDPATNQVVSTFELSCQDSLNEAVSSASEAFPAWKSQSVSSRVRVMLEYQQLLRDNIEWLIPTITQEQGKTLSGNLYTDAK